MANVRESGSAWNRPWCAVSGCVCVHTHHCLEFLLQPGFRNTCPASALYHKSSFQISTGDQLSPLHLHGVCTVRARSTAPSAVTQRAVLSCMFQVKEEPGYKQLNSNTMHTVLTHATLFYKGVRGQTELVCSDPQAIFCIYLMSNKQQQKLFIYQFHELAHC